MVKWQTVSKLLGGSATIVFLISMLINLNSISTTNSGDIYCENECESFINITTKFWRICFEESERDDVLYKKQSRSRTLWVNLNNVDNIVSTNPDIQVDWLVPTYGGKWRPIKSGDCWDRGKVNKIKLVGHKEIYQDVKWNFDIGEEINIDPIWEGIPDLDLIGNEKVSEKHIIQTYRLKTYQKTNKIFNYERKVLSGDANATYYIEMYQKENCTRQIPDAIIPDEGNGTLTFINEIYDCSFWTRVSEEGKKVKLNKSNTYEDIRINIIGGDIPNCFKTFYGERCQQSGDIIPEFSGVKYPEFEQWLMESGSWSGTHYGTRESNGDLILAKYTDIFETFKDDDESWVMLNCNDTTINVLNTGNMPVAKAINGTKASPTDPDIVAGTVGNAFVFDGVNDTFSLGTITANFDHGGFRNKMTFAMQFRPYGDATTNQYVYDWGGKGDMRLNATGCETHGILVEWCSSATCQAKCLYNNGTLNWKDWNEFVMTKNSTGSDYYINGVRVYTDSVTTDIDVSASDNRFGSKRDSTSFAKVDIDNIYFSNETWTQSDIDNFGNISDGSFLSNGLGSGSIINWEELECYNQSGDVTLEFRSSPDNSSWGAFAEKQCGDNLGMSNIQHIQFNATFADATPAQLEYVNISYSEILPPNITLLANGFVQDLSAVELGTVVNISANITGNLNVSFDILHPDYGINYGIRENQSNISLFINYFRMENMNDSNPTKNLTFTGSENINIGISAHQYDDVVNLTLNVTGYINGATYPTDVKIYVNNTLSNSLGVLRETGDFTLNTFSDGDDAKNITLSGGSISTAGYLKILKSSTITGARFNLSGHHTGGIDQLHDMGEIIKLDGTTETMCGNKTYDFIELKNGATLNICNYDGSNETKGKLFLNVTHNITVDKTSKIVGFGDGFRGTTDDGEGPGGGKYGLGTYGGGGGGGYGNVGGAGGTGSEGTGGAGGVSYDSNSGKGFPMGSGGAGEGQHTFSGSDGGAGLYLLSPLVNISGNISVYGDDGSGFTQWYGSSGAGSGGTILIEANYLIIEDIFKAYGGAGSLGWDSGHGGSGAGGRIKLFFISLNDDSFSVNLSGGSTPGNKGGEGSLYQEQTGNLTYNPFVEVGSIDGTREWEWIDGHFDDKHNRTKDLTSAVNTFLDSCTADSEGFCLVPISLYSESDGIIEVSNIDIDYTYNPNPVQLDNDLIGEYLGNSSNETDIPITFFSSEAGIIEVTDINWDYAGGNFTYEILAHDPDYLTNETMNITYFYSKWDYTFPQYVRFFEVIPSTPTSDNVTPYGQTSNRAMLNITILGYGGQDTNISFYNNESEPVQDCVNITISDDEFKSNGTLIVNQTWTELLMEAPYTNKTDFWFWFDYECNFTQWRLWEPDFDLRGCCTDCLCSEGRA